MAANFQAGVSWVFGIDGYNRNKRQPLNIYPLDPSQ